MDAKTFDLVAIPVYAGVPVWHVRDSEHEGYTICSKNLNGPFTGSGLKILVKRVEGAEPTCSVCRSRSNLPRLEPSIVTTAGRRASTVGAFRER